MNYQFTKHIYGWASFYSIDKNRASPEADGKWLESPRNKISLGNFPKLKDVYNSCSAKYRTATIAGIEHTYL